MWKGCGEPKNVKHCLARKKGKWRGKDFAITQLSGRL